MAKETVRNALFFLRSRTRRDDFQVSIDLHRIGVDDRPAKLLRNRERKCGLAGSGRACDENDRRRRNNLRTILGHGPIRKESGEMSKMTNPLVATFVAAPDAGFEAETALKALEAAGVTPKRIVWLDQGAALDVFFDFDEETARSLQTSVENLMGAAPIDVIAQSVTSRRKALLVADMDATMIAQECLDELAQTIGQGEAVAALTARAMLGEIDFESALTTRVALFEGVSVESIEKLVGSSNAESRSAPSRRHHAQAWRAHRNGVGWIYAFRGPDRRPTEFSRSVRQPL